MCVLQGNPFRFPGWFFTYRAVGRHRVVIKVLRARLVRRLLEAESTLKIPYTSGGRLHSGEGYGP